MTPWGSSGVSRLPSLHVDPAHDDQIASRLPGCLRLHFPRKMVIMLRLTSALPWLIALIGLAVPLVGGGGAGWPYVVAWLIVLGALFVTRPMRHADRQDRIKWALIAAVLSVVPGLVFGGIYLLPAVLTWLLIELLYGPPSTAAS
jgi:DMSO reductase anchor subunit